MIMRKPIILGWPFLLTLFGGSLAQAADYYVSPDATATEGCTHEAPCVLGAGVAAAVAGDTVILMDGVYHEQLYAENSGTADAWITFKADQCATPILEGEGDDGDSQPTGAGSNAAEYLRFEGIVSRGWNAGFGNGWADEGETSNGHFEFKHCIADANGRTGFTFYRADSIHIQNCISGHNGSSTLHSWSSGVTLLGSTGTNLVEGSVSFENTEGQKHTDGNGFIVDEGANDATFLNNLAFGNGGSCLRLTKSSGTTFINNTCYHNAQDPAASGPNNPSELYFTNADSTSTATGVNFMNNVLVNTGSGPGAQAVVGQPTSGWSNNVIKTGSVTMFTDPEGNNPDFTIAAGASDLLGMGATGGAVPGSDIGFDPKCIKKGTPTTYGTYTNAAWWKYTIDYDYIKSLGGVAYCFNPKTRTGTPDIGSYANGAVTTQTPDTCVASYGGSMGIGGATSAGGDTGAGGVAGDLGGSTGNGGDASLGGNTGTGGVVTDVGGGSSLGGDSGTGGALSTAGGDTGTGGAISAAGGDAGLGGNLGTGGNLGGSPGAGGTLVAAAGGSVAATGGSGTGGSNATAGAVATAGTPATGTVGGAANAGGMATAGQTGVGTDAAKKEDSGCGCRVAGSASHRDSLASAGLFGLALLAIRRRRSSR